MKRCGFILTILALLIVASPVAASVITGALYEGAITATNTSYTAQRASVPFDFGTQGLLDGGYIDSGFSNVAIQNSSGEDVAFMPGQSGDPWMMFIPQISQNSALNYSLYTGGTTDMEGSLAYFPGDAGMTVPDDASLEPGDNFEFEYSLYLDSTIDDYLVSKTDAFDLSVDDNDITANIVDITPKDNPTFEEESPNYIGDIRSIWGDDTHIYAGGWSSSDIKKYLKSDMSFVEESSGYGDNINTIWGDDTHIYAAGDNGGGNVKKYLKSDMSFVGESSDNGTYIFALWGDDTYIYAGGNTDNIKKYLKSDMSFVGESPSYGNTIDALWGDDTYIYAGGETEDDVKKYLKSDMSFVDESPSYGGRIFALWGDDTHIYAAGDSGGNVKKYLKSDMSFVGESSDNGTYIFALWGDDTYIYAGGNTDNIKKYLKSDMSFVGESPSYGDTIRTLWGDNTHIYAGGETEDDVKKYLNTINNEVSTTATGISAGEYTIKVSADGTDLKLYIDDVEQDSTALDGASVPDNDNNWVFFQSGVAPYVYYAKHTVGGSLVGHWYWEYDTTFTDQSGNGNDATPTFRTATTDADVSAELKSFSAISQSVFDDTADSSGPEIVSDADLPPVFAGFYVDLNADNLPSIGPAINSYLDDQEVPHEFFWLPVVYLGGAAITMLGYRYTRKLLPSAAAGIIWNVFFGAVIGSGFWGLIPIGVITAGEMINRKKVSV